MNNSSNKLISFDIDSVLLDTEKRIINFIKKEYNVSITQKEITHWDYYAMNFPKVIELFTKPELYDNVEAIKNMDKVLSKLISKVGSDKIQFITSSHSNIEKAKEETVLKLYKHIKDIEKIDFIHVGLKCLNEKDTKSHNKFEYSNNTILIDDAIHNIDSHINFNEKNKGILVDFGYGWNQNYSHKNVIRANTTEDILRNTLKLIK